MCSYVTLPLYALVTQMGSTMKKSIFDEQTSKALMKWHQKALQRKNSRGKSPPRTLGGSSAEPLTQTRQQNEQDQHQQQSATIVTPVDI